MIALFHYVITSEIGFDIVLLIYFNNVSLLTPLPEVCVRVCVCLYVSTCVCACARVRACVCAYVCGRAYVCE